MNKQALSASVRDHSGESRRIIRKRADGDGTSIEGWGADLDHKNRPAYPMERTPPRLDNPPAHRPVDQPLNMTVYHSVERPGVTPVFGTSTPPSGLSGMMRSLAYKISENDIRHWLLLLLADRVNVVEGLADDVLSGRVPNILAEMGIKAEWQHNRAGLLRKVAIVAAIGGVAYALSKQRAGKER